MAAVLIGTWQCVYPYLQSSKWSGIWLFLWNHLIGKCVFWTFSQLKDWPLSLKSLMGKHLTNWLAYSTFPSNFPSCQMRLLQSPFLLKLLNGEPSEANEEQSETSENSLQKVFSKSKSNLLKRWKINQFFYIVSINCLMNFIWLNWLMGLALQNFPKTNL